METVLRKLWSDDRGAVISTELVLVIAILIFGVIPGLVALRNSVIAAMGTCGNTLVAIVPSFTFSGFAIANAAGGGTIAVVQGYQLDPTTAHLMSGSQVSPIQLTTGAVIPPAP